MQSDAKSAFYRNGQPNDRPGFHFGGLWGHFGALWVPNGSVEEVFLEVDFLVPKKSCKQSRVTPSREGQWAEIRGGPYKP